MIWLIACLVGLAMGRRWPTVQPIILLLGSGLIFLERARLRFLFALGCVLLGIGLGWWRGAVFRQELLPYQDLYAQTVTVRVTATTDGTYATTSGNLGFDGAGVHFISPVDLRLPGVLKIESRGLPAVFRGDRVEISGKLYPAGGSRQGSIKFASGTLVSRNLNWLEKVRLRFVSSMLSVMAEPQASFGLGILVGQRSTLPKSVSDNLSAVGLTHIIAVSGYNLTIIIQFVGKRFGRSKYQTLVLSIGLITIFVLITGFSASIVRAAIVSMLSLGAWYYGRTIRPLLILLLSGVLTAGWYPVYLWSDIGWYLSFAAFFGVLIVAPLVTAYFWKGRQPRGMMPLVIESASAQAMAAPIIMYIFQQTSLIALPANMVVVPLVPLSMLLLAVGAAAGVIMPGLGPWLAWPAQLLLGYVLQMVDLMSRAPHAQVPYALPAPLMITFYVFVGLACWWLWMKTKPKYVKITDEGV